MEKKSLMFSALMMVTTIIFAQNLVKDPNEFAVRQTERMKTVLSLDDKQYASIKGINEKYAVKQSELRKDSERVKNEKHSAMSEIKREKENEVKTVLTPEQQKTWEEHKSAQAEKRKQHRGKVSERHGSRMKTALSLSDEQSEKIAQLNAEFKAKAEALKKETGDGKEFDKEGFKKLRAEREASMKQILTEEQYKKWSEMKSEKKGADHKKSNKKVK